MGFYKSIILTDFAGEPAFKKRNIPPQNIESNNKENLNDNLISINPVKPVIAGEFYQQFYSAEFFIALKIYFLIILIIISEHLTVRKSVDKMDIDEPEVYILRNPRKKIFTG